MDVSRVLRIIAAVVCVAWVLGSASAAEASCVAPSVTVDHASVARGDVLEIRGSYFWSTCIDTGGSGRAKPEANISLRIAQGDVVIPLALVDANNDYRFAVQVRVPGELAVGPATVEAWSMTFRDVTSAIVITDGVVPGAASAPPTFVVGRDSTSPRIDAPEGSSNTRWILTGVVVAALAAAIVGVMVFRWGQRRPHQWIQDPK